MENNEFIKDINFKEKLLLDFLQTDVPKYVSHYTGAEAATSIIKTHKLRFTLASTFSDFTEDECFYDLIEDIKRSDAVFKDFYMAYIEVKNNIKKENLYICCFSSEDDSAGMWNYGEGRDVNLLLNLREISLSLLHDNFVSESFRFDILRVIYNENEIYDYLFNIINSFYLLWENNKRHNFYISSEFYFLEEVKYHFKNKSFSFENEIRIIDRKINLCSDKFEEENKTDCVNEENHNKKFFEFKCINDTSLINITMSPFLSKNKKKEITREILNSLNKDYVGFSVGLSNCPIR